MKYQKKPIIIDAIKWEGGDYEILNTFCGMNWSRADTKDMPDFEEKENVVVWNPLEKQWLHCPVGAYIIRGIDGELYPCNPSVFERTYDLLPTNPTK